MATTLQCLVRRKAVAATPEEVVRQALLADLLAAGYPLQLIAVERQVKYNGLAKRFDVLVFSQQGRPLLLAECKAPDVGLSAAQMRQALTYNSQFGARYLLLDAGAQRVWYDLTAGAVSVLSVLPPFSAI